MTYPKKIKCDNCGQGIFVHWSNSKKKEYATNTIKSYEDWHNCPNWKGTGKPAPAPAPVPKQPTIEKAEGSETREVIKDYVMKVSKIFTSRTDSLGKKHTVGNMHYGDGTKDEDSNFKSTSSGVEVEMNTLDMNTIEKAFKDWSGFLFLRNKEELQR